MAEHPNVQRLREGYDAFSRGDLDALRELLAPDVVWHAGGNNSLTGDYKGLDEVFGFFGRIFQETGGSFKNEIHDLLANDEHGVALVHSTAERNGKRLKQNVTHVFHINDEGKPTEFWGFSEDQKALDEFWS